MGKKFFSVFLIFVLPFAAACSGKKYFIADASAETQAVTQGAVPPNSSPKTDEGKTESTLPIPAPSENGQEPSPPAPEVKDQSIPSVIEGKTTISSPPVTEEKNQPPAIEEKQFTESKPADKQGKTPGTLSPQPLPSPSTPSPPPSGSKSSPVTEEVMSPSQEEAVKPPPVPPVPPSLQKKVQTPKEQTPPPAEEGEEMVFNFDNADINEVVSTIGDILGINYIAPPGLTGVVNIHTKGKLAKKDLFSVLETILKLNNFTIVKKGDLYHIAPLQTAKQEYAPTLIGGKREEVSLTDAFIIQIVPLKYASAVEVSKVIQPLMTPVGQVIAKDTFLILVDTSANINKLLSLVELFDVDIFEQVHMQLYEVKKADIEEMATELDTIFKVLAAPAEGQGPRAGGIAFVPITRINMLMAVSSNDKLLEKAIEWAKKLDTEISEGGAKVFVYFVQNGKAVDLANVLNQVFLGMAPQQTTTFQSKLRETSSSLFPSGRSSSLFPSQGSSLNQPMQTSSQTYSQSSQQTQTPTQTQSASPTSQPSKKESGQPSGLLKGEVQIVIAETTNALIIQATERDYRVIEKTLKQLDIYPKQVLIEVMIAEIRLDDALNMGVEWSYTNKFGDATYTAKGTGLAPTLDSANNIISGLDTAVPAGFYYNIVKTGLFDATLRAYASQGKVNILSSPHIIASDNKEAEIDVTQEVPITSGSVTTSSAEPLVTQTTEYRDTGIILKVTPHINDKGLVTLDISQEVSAIDNATKVEGNDNPVFLKRAAITSMVVQNGQTVIIGGLINETRNKGKSGIPYLSKIPALGWLFGYHNDSVNRSELMLQLTPHVITSIEEADLITKEFREKLDIIKKSPKDKVPETNSGQTLGGVNEK
jgi:general secretion pathway protein D